MPVIRLNSVVLPAPLGPIMALRSPGLMLSVTLRVACNPPKLLQRPFTSSTGLSSFICVVALTREFSFSGDRPGLKGAPAYPDLFAVLAGWEVAIIDRLSEELLLSIGPELADLGIGLDHGVPEFVLVVVEHLFLLDLLDVDVLDRITIFIELD